jgi:hypothetical protein
LYHRGLEEAEGSVSVKMELLRDGKRCHIAVGVDGKALYEAYIGDWH